jgi:serine/threonine-protein kinase
MDPSALGKYRVLGLLGEGSMGRVFLAHDPTLDRNVAVKVMSGSSVGDAKVQERFEREAKAIAKLHHQNIVTIHDLGYDANGTPFIAMELLEGADLHDLTETRPVTFGEKLDIVAQVCRGLTHAHGKGIVHRDIKPANIFVVRDGTAKIMDFGVSRWMRTTQTQAGLVVGTAGYISPEQLRGKPVDERTDIFSLGVVLVEILTNEVLFSGDNIETIFFKTLGRETPTLVAPDGQELPALQAIARRATAKDAGVRYRSAEEMEQAIRSLLESHRSLLGEKAPFTTREGHSQTSPLRETSKAPTRIVRPPVTMRRPPGNRPAASGAPERSRRAAVAVGAALFVATAAAATALYTLLVEKPLTSSSSAPQITIPDRNDDALVADAALAIGRGNLDEAQSLIEQGERADIENHRWKELRAQLRERELDAEKRHLASRHVEDGRRALERGDSRGAVDFFTRAVASDPMNTEARKGLDDAIALASKPPEPTKKSEPPPAPSPPRKFVESRTRFTPRATGESELLGFEAEPGLDVGETRDPFFPAQIVLELSPPDARAGQAYTIRVSLFNEGYRAIEVGSLELVNRFEGKTSGKGQPIPLLARSVPPQATARIYEISGTWKESLGHGEIEATVVIDDAGTLTKTLRW